jgi:hypothetical protein
MFLGGQNLLSGASAAACSGIGRLEEVGVDDGVTEDAVVFAFFIHPVVVVPGMEPPVAPSGASAGLMGMAGTGEAPEAASLAAL